MVMDSNGEECSLRDYDLVCDSSVGWKLINLLTGPEMVRLVRMIICTPTIRRSPGPTHLSEAEVLPSLVGLQR